MVDFNDAGPQRGFDLIPNGTIATVQMIINNGGLGEGGLLKQSKNGECQMLDVEFTVVEGPYAKRKIFQPLVLSGSTKGQAEAAEICGALLRAILESAHGIDPNDKSEAAQIKRKAEYANFNNLRFVAKIGIELTKNVAYRDKNIIRAAITPNMKQWHPVEQLPASAQMGLSGLSGPSVTGAATATAKPAQAIARPEWAQ